jgi:hypothetical protein
VFRALDPATERLVAVKLFTLDLAPERVHHLVAELERVTSATLTHPAIAAPLATGIRDNRPYLVMEHVAADSLDVAVRQYGAAPPAEALRVAAQLAGALDFAAVVNVAHGALHPRDVLLSPDETRLTGLGVARAFETINVAAPVRRPYTPPEEIAGADWDRRADVFSLAALVHELLWGRRVSANGAQAGASLTSLPGADLDALRAVFSRALAERADDRFATALDFAQALTLAFPGAASAGPPVREHTVVTVPASEAAVTTDARLPLDEPAGPAVAPPARKISRPRVPPAAPAESPARKPADAPPIESPLASEPPIAALDPSDLDLRAAEVARYEAVEAPPAASPDVPPGAIKNHGADAPVSALERSRSALWPLALALVVGIAIGFASGYGAGNHDRSAASTRADAAASPESPAALPSGSASATAPAATAGHDSNESASADDGKESTAAQTPAAPAPPSRVADNSSAKAGAGTKSEIAANQSEIRNLKSEISSPGRLLVRSTPAGARVFVDGREAGLTPVAVRELGHGDHRVRIARDGYTSEERRITITTSRPAQSLTISLLRAPLAEPPTATPTPATPGTTGRFVGALSVDSRPSGAKVFVDGKLEGTTPLQLAGLDAGEHVVRIERDGYRRWSSSVRVVAYEQNRVTASLEK